ncbi:MAG: hypothetical protein JSS75_11590 [Bacteroidetes bacterium]|nr:hypothetical protein [Bacteroidota bacterium]
MPTYLREMRIGVFWFVLIAATALSGCLEMFEDIHVLRDGRFLVRKTTVVSRSDAPQALNERLRTPGYTRSDSEVFAFENELHAWKPNDIQRISGVTDLQVRDSVTDSLIFVISEAVASSDSSVERLHGMIAWLGPGLSMDTILNKSMVALRVHSAGGRTSFRYTYNIEDPTPANQSDSAYRYDPVSTALNERMRLTNRGTVRIYGSNPRIKKSATNARIVDGHIEWLIPPDEVTEPWLRKSNGATFEVGPEHNPK